MDFLDWNWLNKYYLQPKFDIDSMKLKDIRGYYKYIFYKVDGIVYLKLINGVGQKSGQILKMSKSHFQTLPSISPQIFKYGQLNTVGQYQFHKLPISTEKQVDIFSMRGFFFLLQNS
jgi:hypothetical protein